MNNEILKIYQHLKKSEPNLSLDETLYKIYKEINKANQTFSEVKAQIISALNINEYDYYTKKVSKELKKYIENEYFPKYEKNDQGHGIVHILEVIRRMFALNDTFKLNLEPDILFAISACHDIGKYIDHDTHEKIAASHFYCDDNMKKYFSENERKLIKEAIEDHRSSKSDEPRSIYGKLISSADRNTTIDIVFIRSFFVSHERTPDMNIEEYLDYIINRLKKRYSEENPENMFFEDEIYRVFLNDMRELLKQEEKFKKCYCEVNHITDRNHKVKDEPGRIEYIQAFHKSSVNN